MAMTRDSTMMVESGYANMLEFAKDIGDLGLMFTYQFVAPMLFGKQFSWTAFMPLLLFPIAMLSFLRCRNEVTTVVLKNMKDAMDKLVSSVALTVNNYTLIADYRRREQVSEQFLQNIRSYNTAHREAGIVLKNNAYFAKWLSELVVGAFLLAGGCLVLRSEMSLGMFLANINIFRKIGSAWGGIYKLFLDIMCIFPALQNVTVHLNLPIDVPTHKALNRRRRRESALLWHKRKTEPEPGDWKLPVDRLQISVGNLPFTHFSTSSSGFQRTISLSNNGLLEINQGEMVFLTGPSGGGKSTLLKIIGGEMLPDPSRMSSISKHFIPPHLRVLHVASPLFFDDTLLENLVFGVSKGDNDGRLDRVVAICEILGVHRDVLEYLHRDDHHRWDKVLSSTQCQLLSIARALVANPEVLCIHKPTQPFNEDQGLKVTKVLKDFVMEHGLMLKEEPASARRPRTLMMTTMRKANFVFADRIFHVSMENGIREVPPSEYTNLVIEAVNRNYKLKVML